MLQFPIAALAPRPSYSCGWPAGQQLATHGRQVFLFNKAKLPWYHAADKYLDYSLATWGVHLLKSTSRSKLNKEFKATFWE
jgi:hypothetical protein